MKLRLARYSRIALASTLALSFAIAPLRARASEPRPKAHVSSKSQLYMEPDTHVDGFAVWLGADGKLDRVVVMVEGFDLNNQMTARGLLAMVGPVADRLRAEGIDLLVVDFPDSHLAPDALAPYLDRAIRAAAAASGHSVAVAGFSAGGIVARWALVAAEEQSDALPVHTLILVDTPNRGARLNPGLQALTGRYGAKTDREAIACPAARALLTCVPVEVKWKRIGLPGAQRQVPVSWKTDSTEHDALYARLQRLNDRRGYPKQCRLVGIAQGSRANREDEGDLYHMWLPFGFDWTCKSEAEDQAPGSLLPRLLASRLKLRFPLGVAGAYLRSAPTFIATESALDAAPGETPPFDEWYVRPDNLPLIAHDQPSPDVAAFALRVISQRCSVNAVTVYSPKEAPMSKCSAPNGQQP